MSLYSIPNIIVGVYILILGFFVLVSNPKAGKNSIFFLLSVTSSTWLISYGITYSIKEPELAFQLLKIGHIAAIYISPTIYGFMIAILGSYQRKFDVNVLKLTIVYALISSFLVLFYPNYLPTIVKRYWGYYPIGGPLMIAYAFWTFSLAVRCIYALRKASKVAKKELHYDNYQRFKYYALSVSIFVFASLDYLPKFDLEIYPFGYVFVAIFSSITTYAIVRHKLLDIDIVIRRGVFYSLLISVITFVYLSIILVSEHIFRSYFGYKSILIALIVSSIVSLSFNTVRVNLQKVVDRYFFRIDPDKLIEENVKLKDVVQKQDQMKAVATLAAGMAHEIKNPLTSIKTFAEYLPQKYDDPEFREKFQRIVVDEVDRVNNIVRQLLDFSKPKEPELKETPIVSVLDDTLNLLNNNLLKNKIEVVKDYKANPSPLIDKNQLRQAFLNIFLNSIHAMPNGGTLTVTTSLSSDLPARPAGGRLLTSVKDTGCGIPKEHLPHVFDPFYSTKEEGTGLGLSIVHGIITKHGGKIKVESEEGKGTTISVVL